MFFTGLPAAGKSTLAGTLYTQLRSATSREVVLLDGDAVRRQISPSLGFSRQDRDEHIHRVGSIASAITKRGGVCICASIAPYDAARKSVRRMIEAVGGFVLVYVNTPVETCRARDPKGLYTKASAGVLCHFTGISDPYEPPDDAEIIVDTMRMDVECGARLIFNSLRACL